MGQVVFRLPDVGEGIAEAELVAWHVQPGALVSEDDPLVEVMTDKATVEIPSPYTGRVVSVAGTPGDRLAVGSDLVVFELEVAPEPEPQPQRAPVTDTLSPAATIPPPAEARPPLPAATVAPAPSPVVAPQPSRPGGAPATSPGRALAAPAVRERAARLGIALASVPGSGPEGRVTHADLDRRVAGTAATPVGPAPDSAARDGVEEVRVIGLRRRIAERMQDAVRRIPHFTYAEELDVTALEELRAALNQAYQGAHPRLTLLPFLIRALVRARTHFPQVNALYDDEAGVVRRHAAVHVGIATQTEQGLMVPVLRHAEALDPWQCATGVAVLAAAARDGTAARATLTGSTITITSLGRLGGIVTTPIINAPEVAIIGVNRIVERPVIRGGAVAIGRVMNLSCSFDHRVVDGFDAAAFVQELKSLLERPAMLFIAPPAET